MIYVTGDTHGEMSIAKVWDAIEPEDTLIICGDFGNIWTGSEREQFILDELDKNPGTILFVDGNHENFPMIYEYPVIEWNGGLVHQIRPSVLHLMRGQIFTIEGKTIFVMGGGTSIDKAWRIEGVSWWSQEMPTKQEYDTALDNLDSVNWKVDYVCTHVAPTDIQNKIFHKISPCGLKKPDDELTKFLQTVDEKLEYEKWFFGHYHEDFEVDKKHLLLFDDIIPIMEKTDEVQD